MKKKSIFLIGAVAATAMMVSCQAPKLTTTVEEHYSQARVLDVQTKADIKPVQAELRVDTERYEKPWHFTSAEIAALGGDLEKIHARAAFKVLQETGGDELVAPLYDVATCDEHENCYKVTVIGYIGNFVNWK